MNEELVLICPRCASSSVDFSELAGTPAKCRVCQWSGYKQDLYPVRLAHLQGTREGISIDLYNDIRRLIGGKDFMLGFAAFLDRWGFVSLSEDKGEATRLVARYGAAVARGLLVSVISEREQLEKERHGL